MTDPLELPRKFIEYVRREGFGPAFQKVIDYAVGRRRKSQEIRRTILSLPSIQARFEAVYKENYWGDPESRSGHGSTLEWTRDLRPAFQSLLTTLEVKSLFDAPCGDWNWMKAVELPSGMLYIGGDIVDALVKKLTRKFASENARFVHCNIIEDNFPTVDLWLCRDTLFHLSFADIRSVLYNFTKSGSTFALLTSHPHDGENRDIVTGDFRLLDLTRAPFHLPLPERHIRDIHPNREWREFPRILGLWTRGDIETALRNMDR